MPCCCRSGMQSIRGKTCLSPTKAWSWSRRVPPLTCLPAQSRSSTHRLVLTASTNAQFAGRAYTPPSQHFFFLNAKERHHSRSLSVSPSRSPFGTVGKLVRDLLDWWESETSYWWLTERQQCSSATRTVKRECCPLLAFSKTAANITRACRTTVFCVRILL